MHLLTDVMKYDSMHVSGSARTMLSAAQLISFLSLMEKMVQFTYVFNHYFPFF